MLADAMTDAVLGSAALDAERAADAAAELEVRGEAEYQARDEALRTPYSLAWALDRADVFSEPGLQEIASERLFIVQAHPWAADVTPRELVACLLWCRNDALPAVRAALLAYVVQANADLIRARAADLVEAACPA